MEDIVAEAEQLVANGVKELHCDCTRHHTLRRGYLRKADSFLNYRAVYAKLKVLIGFVYCIVIPTVLRMN